MERDDQQSGRIRGLRAKFRRRSDGDSIDYRKLWQLERSENRKLRDELHDANTTIIAIGVSAVGALAAAGVLKSIIDKSLRIENDGDRIGILDIAPDNSAEFRIDIDPSGVSYIEDYDPDTVARPDTIADNPRALKRFVGAIGKILHRDTPSVDS